MENVREEVKCLAFAAPRLLHTLDSLRQDFHVGNRVYRHPLHIVEVKLVETLVEKVLKLELVESLTQQCILQMNQGQEKLVVIDYEKTC